MAGVYELFLHCTERREADVLVQHLDMAEPDLAQQVQLKCQRTRSVFFFDVCEDVISVGFVLEPGQVIAVLSS